MSLRVSALALFTALLRALPGCFYSVPDPAQESSDAGADATPCEGGAAELATSSKNCGACGHDCRGGECLGGVCDPAFVATGQQSPSGLALDEDYVYWANQAKSGTVSRVRKTGGDPETIATGQAGAFDIAVDAATVYWTTIGAGTVMSASKNGGEAMPLATGQNAPNAIAIDDARVYWTTTGGAMPEGKVRSIGKDGTGEVEIATDPGYLYAIAVDDTYLYWSNRGTRQLMRVPKGGGAPASIGTAMGQPRGVHLDRGAVYWVDDAGPIMKHEANVGAPIADAGPGARDVAVHASGVYWTNLDNGVIGGLLAGEDAPIALAKGQGGPHDIAVDDVAIYWTNWGSTTVKQLVR